MIDFYLPLVDQNIFWPIPTVLGFISGFLAGMFGVSASFLVTPTLIALGISPAVAVASQSNQLIAISSGELYRFIRQGLFDYKLVWIVFLGSLIGVYIGVHVKGALENYSNYTSFVVVSYIVLLFALSTWFLLLYFKSKNHTEFRKPGQHSWIHRLPLKMRFRGSKLFVSVIVIIFGGVIAGLFSFLLGIGGAIIIYPILISLFKVPPLIAQSASIFQIFFASLFSVYFHNQISVASDIVLVILLLTGGLPGLLVGRDLSRYASPSLSSLSFLAIILPFTAFFTYFHIINMNAPLVSAAVRQ